MTKQLLPLFYFVISITVYGQIPSYYNNVDLSLSGNSLKDELATITISEHTTFLSYTPGVWDALKESDEDPNNSNNILLIYGYNDSGDPISDRTRGKDENGGSVGNWNREHVYARSLGTPNLGDSGPGSDAHSLRPCDLQMNSTRNNRKFGDGSGNAGITSSGDFYPGDEWKGDVARMMMYMYLRYGSQCLPRNVGTGNSVSGDSDMIDLFLEWNAEDPVSSFEDRRNDVITDIQGNRNPFVDNPGFATLIWNGPQAEDKFNLGTGGGGGDGGDGGDGGGDGGGSGSEDDLLFSEYVEGSSYNKALEIANLTGSSVSLSSYSIKKQTNGSGSWSSGYSLSGSLSNGDVYVIAHSNASSDVTNVADITTTNTIITFNGNDAVGLFKNDVLVDIIGVFDSSANYGQNVTLRRQSDVSAPNTSYTTSEWDSYASNTFSGLGNHNGTSNPGDGGGSTGDVVLNEATFESGWDDWVDGGGDCARYSGSYAAEGDYAIRIRDNSSTASSMTLNDINVSSYDTVEVAFSFYGVGMESGEDFWVRYNDGSGWETVEAFVSGTDFSNGNVYGVTVTLDSSSYDFVSDASFRFQCDASANSDAIYIDDVTISGIDGSNAAKSLITSANTNTSIEYLYSIAIDDALMSEDGLTAYPNPASNQVTIALMDASEATYRIFDIVGQIVKTGKVGMTPVQIDDLNAGLYIIEVNDGDETMTKKLIKR